ncbi:MAG: peptidase U32 family protein [Bacteroidota bacterium]
MKLKRKDIEIMAPAGSYESLQATIQGGADSVYFGIEQLNMRARSANNFNRENLGEIIKIARENSLKTYLTVNTVIYDHELGTVRDVVDLVQKHNVDAIIASDPSVLNYAYNQNVKVHLSTQLNISNIESLKFYSKFADVAVLARELNVDQVRKIYEGIELEDIRGPKGGRIKIEMFVHGALCMAISGKCYLSLHEHNHSANRGDCLQVCRRSYTVIDRERGSELAIENEYIMSPKDLCTIHFLNKIIDAGARVLKIEGRARSPEYVKTVVRCYNEAVNAIINGNYNREKIDRWQNELQMVFNRGFWDGYYLGQKLGEWSHVYGSQATKKKIYTGKCTNYYDKIAVAEILVESGELSLGDDILIIGPTTGVVETRVKEIRVEHEPAAKAVKSQKCSIPVDTLVRRSDKVYKWIDNQPEK